MELVVLGLLALYGILCTTALVAVLARHRTGDGPPPVLVPEKIEIPDADGPAIGRGPVNDIVPIMAEHFPEQYERYRQGLLPEVERRWIWEACGAILDARAEIEELCS